jgi:hypothetical protein
MPRNRSHEIAEYLSDGYHSEGGEGYSSLTQAYSRAYGRLLRAERRERAAIEARAAEEKDATEEKAANEEKASIETKSSN